MTAIPIDDQDLMNILVSLNFRIRKLNKHIYEYPEDAMRNGIPEVRNELSELAFRIREVRRAKEAA